MSMLALIAALAALSDGAAQPATTAGAGPAVSAPASKTAQADPNATVCRSVMTTGTRFATRECHTRAVWDQMASDSRDETQQNQRAMGIPH